MHYFVLLGIICPPPLLTGCLQAMGEALDGQTRRPLLPEDRNVRQRPDYAARVAALAVAMAESGLPPLD
jgi:hypothetical protein